MTLARIESWILFFVLDLNWCCNPVVLINPTPPNVLKTLLSHFVGDRFSMNLLGCASFVSNFRLVLSSGIECKHLVQLAFVSNCTQTSFKCQTDIQVNDPLA